MVFSGKTYRLERNQLIQLPRDEVFKFFSDAFNLERITPSFLNFRILTKAPIDIQEGTLIDYRIRLFGVPMKWRTRIERFEPDTEFVDNQIRGPYVLWHHTHVFEHTAEGTLMTDVVRYRLPMGVIGRVVHWLFVRRTLDRIFDFRRDALTSCLRVDG